MYISTAKPIAQTLFQFFDGSGFPRLASKPVQSQQTLLPFLLPTSHRGKGLITQRLVTHKVEFQIKHLLAFFKQTTSSKTEHAYGRRATVLKHRGTFFPIVLRPWVEVRPGQPTSAVRTYRTQTLWVRSIHLLHGTAKTLILLRVVVLQRDLKLHRLHKLSLLGLGSLQYGTDTAGEVVSGNLTAEGR